MRTRSGCFAVAAALISATHAQADVTISSAATTNMTCSGGVCAPTATKAVLNVGDLETLLASGNVTVTTTGTGAQASDIDVKAALSWSSSGTLSLLANKSIAIDNPVSITGLSGLTIGTGKSGAFSFGSKGNVSFANLSSGLSINGSSYTLVGNIKTLASDIAANPNGDFALAANYDASGDGSYRSCPIPTAFSGTFTGLGNEISNLTIAGGTEIDIGLAEGLFAEVAANGRLEDIGFINADIIALIKYINAGSLVGENDGAIEFSFATGKMTFGKKTDGGGLVGGNRGTIANSYATDDLAGKVANVGGLVGGNYGLIEDSYAAGNLSGSGEVGGLVSYNGGAVDGSYAIGEVTAKGSATLGGGLVGYNQGGSIENSYATGNVKGGKSGEGPNASSLGGLVGKTYGTISFSYSTGAVTGGTGNYIGGLVGYDESSPGSITDSYWDTDTSGQSQGAGNITNDPGITGLTTAQFQSGLPTGFDPKVWAENSNIDDGFPFLVANKPGK